MSNPCLETGAIVRIRILFISTDNAIRSQIAEGYLRFQYGDIFEVYSAGIRPLTVHPMAVEVMQEIGIDISRQQSDDIFMYLDKNIDLAVSLCEKASYACPVFPGARKTVHQEFFYITCPQEKNDNYRKEFLLLRDEIISWIDENAKTGGLFHFL
ncbi:MAG: arsenate reductase ArsC [Methanomicrobiales archaeon]|nr:arsenate reductase ArsC [Methanomicrobiales archaeon]